MTNDPTPTPGSSSARPAAGASVPSSADLDLEVGSPADDAIIGVVFRWSLVAFGVVGAVVAGFLLLGGEPEGSEQVIDRDPIVAPPQVTAGTPDTRPRISFTDMTLASGISFVHESGAAGDKLLPETMGGGVAIFDADDDGDADVLLVNGRTWTAQEVGHDVPPAGDRPSTHRLYLNDGSGTFRDATAGSGLDVSMYGFGPAIADIDGDGDHDVFIAALGGDRLFRNDGPSGPNGEPRFTDITDAAGIAGPADGWSTGAGFLDADGDGDLDLFVCRYVQWTPEIDRSIAFTLNGTDRAYGPPKNFRGAHCVLWRNDGDGSFTDVSGPAGIEVVNRSTGEPMSKALAARFVDLEPDGDVDIIVANDTVENFLFRNRGDGTFDELGIDSGVGVDPMGNATGAMGMDAADLSNDGRLCVAIGNFAGEPTSLFVQQSSDGLQFADMAGMQGIGSPSRRSLTFGLLFIDVDLDGRLDLVQANGHLDDEINEVVPSQTYRQAAQVFWNAGPDARRRFVAVPPGETGALGTPIVGRGLAAGDLDGDGDADLILTQTGGSAVVLRNDTEAGQHWLRVRVRGQAGNPDAYGARVVVRRGDVTMRRDIDPTRSYLAQVEPIAHFGLGNEASVDSVTVIWPDGVERTIEAPAVDGELRVERPAG